MFCFRIISYYMQDACHHHHHHHPSSPSFPFPPVSAIVFHLFVLLLLLLLLASSSASASAAATHYVCSLPSIWNFPPIPVSCHAMPCCTVMFSLLLVLFICSFNIHRKYIVCLFALVFYVICGKSCVLAHRSSSHASCSFRAFARNFQQRHLRVCLRVCVRFFLSSLHICASYLCLFHLILLLLVFCRVRCYCSIVTTFVCVVCVPVCQPARACVFPTLNNYSKSRNLNMLATDVACI